MTERSASELGREAYEAFRTHDIERAVSLVHPDVTFSSLIMESEGGEFHGHDGLREFFAGMLSVFPDWRPELLSLRELDPETVLAEVDVGGSGSVSGAGAVQRMWQVARLRKGRFASWAFYRTEAEALAAAEAGADGPSPRSGG